MATREKNAPATKEAKRQQITSLCNAITTICDAWDDAVEAEQARGYGIGKSPDDVSGGPGYTIPFFDAEGNRHKELDERVPTVVGDPTSAAALRFDIAGQWLLTATRALALLLRLSVNTNGSYRTFYPPDMRVSLEVAAEDVIEMWPKNVSRLIKRIHNLANTARKEWPPTPQPGEKIGDVVVGERAQLVDVCAECGKPIGGGVADPLARIDDKAYHRTPCYQTVWQRNKRRRSSDDRSEKVIS